MTRQLGTRIVCTQCEIIPILQQQHQKWSRVQNSSTQGNRWQDNNISCCIIYCIHLSLYFLDRVVRILKRLMIYSINTWRYFKIILIFIYSSKTFWQDINYNFTAISLSTKNRQHFVHTYNYLKFLLDTLWRGLLQKWCTALIVSRWFATSHLATSQTGHCQNTGPSTFN